MFTKVKAHAVHMLDISVELSGCLQNCMAQTEVFCPSTGGAGQMAKDIRLLFLANTCAACRTA